MQYRNATEQAALRHAIEEIVDRWVGREGEFANLTQQAAVNLKRKLVMEEYEFFSGRERPMPELPEDEIFWWQKESA